MYFANQVIVSVQQQNQSFFLHSAYIGGFVCIYKVIISPLTCFKTHQSMSVLRAKLCLPLPMSPSSASCGWLTFLHARYLYTFEENAAGRKETLTSSQSNATFKLLLSLESGSPRTGHSLVTYREEKGNKLVPQASCTCYSDF